ncbi:MAG: condensation domain-containing protein, partial [Actinobacteria bacterium]|nr:condensation domain-containing protein [Actinomycetota bacterium]
MWFLYRFDGGSVVYNVPVVLRLSGVVDVGALAGALGDVVARHETLRTVFPDRDGTPYQRILSPDQARIDLLVEEVDDADSVLLRVQQLACEPMMLEREIPLRASLLHTGDEEAFLVMLLHHIAADGWSMGPLAADVVAAYTARRDGSEPGWPPLPVQYADYTLWQQELLGDDADPDSVFGWQARYWIDRLDGLPPLVTVPTDRPRPPVASTRSATLEFVVDADLHAALVRLARDHDATVFMVLHAGLAALLTRLGAGTDIPVGSPVAGRTDENLDALVGFFVNTLIWRTDTSGNPSFAVLLEQVRENSLAAYTNQDIPFEYLVERLNPQRSTAHHPLTQIMLALQNNAEFRFDLPGLTAELQHLDSGGTQFDLVINIAETHGPDNDPTGLAGFIEYATDLYDPATITAFLDRYTRLLTEATARPDTPVGALTIITPAERRRLLRLGGNAQRPAFTTIVGLLRDVVRATPETPMLIWGGGELSYAEMEIWSNRIAHRLLARGVITGDRVALVMHRGPGLIAAILGVVTAGAAYVPVDPTYPADRIAFMLDDADPAVVLGDDFLDEDLSAWPGTAPDVTLRPADLAYVIYTSGSTGRPKGVQITHAGIAGLAAAKREAFRLAPGDRVLQF